MTMMQMTIVLPNVNYYKPPSVLVRRAQRLFLQAAISACERGLKWQLAWGLLVVIQQTAVMPDVMFHAAAISASEKSQQQQQALVF